MDTENAVAFEIISSTFLAPRAMSLVPLCGALFPVKGLVQRVLIYRAL